MSLRKRKCSFLTMAAERSMIVTDDNSAERGAEQWQKYAGI